MHHTPVLLTKTIEILEIKPAGTYLDCTAGFGGHSEKILAQLNEKGRLIMVDTDRDAVNFLNEKFRDSDNTTIIHGNYADIELNDKFDGILLDLGISSYQIDNKERGFSFKYDAPLDMRMDRDKENDLIAFLKSSSIKEIAEILIKYSDEHNAINIASAIKERADKDHLNSTFDLKNAIINGCRGRGVKYALRRVFQALRIFVNDEMGNLTAFLIKSESILVDKGRIAVISYHSIEDRIIKYHFKDSSILRRINKKVIKPAYTEIKSNKRARSAKLRCAEKTE